MFGQLVGIIDFLFSHLKDKINDNCSQISHSRDY